MFSAIIDNNLNLPTESIEDLNETLFENQIDLINLTTDAQSLMTLGDTISNLEALQDSINKNGVSLELLSFLNTNGEVTRYLPELAALEDDANNEENKEAGKSKLASTILAATAKFFKNAWDHVAKFKGVLAEFATIAFKKITAMWDWFKNKTFDAKAAEDGQVDGSAPKVGLFTKAVSILTSLFGKIKSMLSGIKLPGTKDEYAEFTKKYGEGVDTLIPDDVKNNPYFNVPGKVYDVDEYGNATPAKEDAQPKESAESAGYTQGGFTSVFNSMKNLFKDGGLISNMGNSISSAFKNMLDSIKNAVQDEKSWMRKGFTFIYDKIQHLWQKAPATFLKYGTKILGVFRRFFKGGK